jgi:hypothetical protein
MIETTRRRQVPPGSWAGSAEVDVEQGKALKKKFQQQTSVGAAFAPGLLCRSLDEFDQFQEIWPTGNTIGTSIRLISWP